MAFSKIAASFTMNTSGVESGSRRVSKSFADIGPALSRLESGMVGLNRRVGTLVFTQLAGLATKAASSMVSMAKASAGTIDSLSKLGRQTGIAYADMASLELAGKLAGVGVDQMAASMNAAAKLFDEARRGSSTATEAFQRLGLDIADLDKMSSADRFQAIAKAIAGLPDPAAKAASAMQIFSEVGVKMVPMFDSMAEAMASAQADTKRFGLALTDLQGRNVEAMNDSFTRAGYALSGMATQVTAELAPAIESVVTMFTDMFRPGTVKAFADAFVKMALDFGEIIARYVDLLSYHFTNVFGLLGNVFEYFESLLPAWSGSVNVWDVSVQGFQRAISLFEVIGQAFFAGIGTFADAFVDMAFDFGEVITEFVDLVSYSFTNVFGYAGNVFEYFGILLPSWSGSIDVWAVSVQVFQRAISLFEGIGKAFLAGMETIAAGLYKVGSYLYGAAAKAAEALGFKEFAEGARSMSNEAAATAAKLMDSAMARAEKGWSDIGNAFSKNFEPTELGRSLVERFEEGWSKIGNAFSENFEPTELGLGLVEGFKGGAESTLEEWRADWEARRKAAAEETEKAADGAAAKISAAFAAPQFQSAVDIRSKDGYGALLKSMFAGDKVAEKHLAVAERQEKVLEGIRLNTEDMGLEAVDI